MKQVTVVTNNELGWDCVCGVYASEEYARTQHRGEYYHFTNKTINKTTKKHEEPNENVSDDGSETILVKGIYLKEMITTNGLNAKPCEFDEKQFDTDFADVIDPSIFNDDYSHNKPYTFIVVPNEKSIYHLDVIITLDGE